MLRSVSSVELSEWQAYEIKHGPIDATLTLTLLREIHQAIQVNGAYFVAVNSNSEEVELPESIPLPWEFDSDGERIYPIPDTEG